MVLNRGVVILALAAVMGSAGAQTLTGAVWYTTNSAKQYSGGYANTYGGDTYSRNLYMSVNQSVGAGTLVNSGNATTAPTRISVNLTSPGTYNFQMYCNGESSLSNPFWGLNLFFDGDDLSPAFSVWNVVNVAGFQGVNPLGTPTLNPLTMGLVQQGNGNSPIAKTFGETTVAITNYRTWSTTAYHVDRVDNFSEVGGLGNGTMDQVIEFTLTSTPVPEPASILVLSALAIRTVTRRKKNAT